jgi:hypothetical protein
VSESNLFELVQLIKSAAGDPSAMTDAIWEAGYRQPEDRRRPPITIDTFFYCMAFDMPTEFWPRDYESVLKNELMKAVGGEDGELAYATASEIAKSVINAGFSKEAANG